MLPKHDPERVEETLHISIGSGPCDGDFQKHIHKKRAERDNVQKFIIDTLKASTISVSEEFKELLPPADESDDTPVETPAEK